jgi:hypothetical protein
MKASNHVVYGRWLSRAIQAIKSPESGDHRLSQGGPVRLESEVLSCKAHTESSPLMSNESMHHVSVKQGRKLLWSLGSAYCIP